MGKPKLQQALEWLTKEISKDQKEIDIQKEKTIREIKLLDKTKMFIVKPKEKKTIFNKIMIAMGYGSKKR